MLASKVNRNYKKLVLQEMKSGAFISGQPVLAHSLFEFFLEILPLCDFVTYIFSLASITRCWEHEF